MAAQPDEPGVDLSPDAPVGVPPIPDAGPPPPVPPPGEGGVVAPGPTPESR